MGTLAAAIHLQPDTGIPLHHQLESALRSQIQAGLLRPGALLPGELYLAEQLGVSRHTVRHAIGVLVTEGLLQRQRHVGTAVTAPGSARLIERSLDSFYAFAWEARARGAQHRSRVLEHVTAPAELPLARRLRLRRGSRVARISLLRVADDEPLMVDTIFLPASLAAGLDGAELEHEALYDVLERAHGVVASHARETIRPVVLDGAMAKLLDVRAGEPAFAVERLTWSHERPIEWRQSIVRGDRYLFSVELPRRPDKAQR